MGNHTVPSDAAHVGGTVAGVVALSAFTMLDLFVAGLGSQRRMVNALLVRGLVSPARFVPILVCLPATWLSHAVTEALAAAHSHALVAQCAPLAVCRHHPCCFQGDGVGGGLQHQPQLQNLLAFVQAAPTAHVHWLPRPHERGLDVLQHAAGLRASPEHAKAFPRVVQRNGHRPRVRWRRCGAWWTR